MTIWVIDASVIGPLLIPDEAAQLHPGLQACLLDGHAIVPQHWRLEVANLGRMAVRRQRLTVAELAIGLAAIAGALPAEDGETGVRAWSQGLALAERHTLTIYDAAYLELAARRSVPLLSADRALRAAARIEAVELVAG